MEIEKIFGRRVRIAENTTVRISPHSTLDTFGVVNSQNHTMAGGLYVPGKTPGTGFFYHMSDSHSYHAFIKEQRRKERVNFWTWLTGHEFSYDVEMKRVEDAIATCTQNVNRQILASYKECLMLAKDYDLNNRVLRALKDQSKRKRQRSQRRSMLASAMTGVKTEMVNCRRDIKATQLHADRMMNDEALTAWKAVTDTFITMTHSRRIMQMVNNDNGMTLASVFFDVGIFNFIQVQGYAPMMRDIDGNMYFLYPDFLIVARSSVDFDVYATQNLTIECGTEDVDYMDYQSALSVKEGSRSHHYHEASRNQPLIGHSRRMGSLSIPQLNVHFLFNHVKSVMAFVDAYNSYKPYMTGGGEPLE